MDDTQDPIQAFMQAAIQVLERRVANSDPKRNEKRWLQGWFNRIETYGSS